MIQLLPKLCLSHVAYLRAVTQGIASDQAARQYLGATDERQVPGLHRWILELARAISRRSGLSAWRLLGLELGMAGATAPQSSVISVEDWAIERGLDGWSFAEQREMYAEEFGSSVQSANEVKREKRVLRLQLRRLALIGHLEGLATANAQLADPIAAWFEPTTAERLCLVGVETLSDLRQRIDRGGAWWVGLKGVGQAKANHIVLCLNGLVAQPKDHGAKFAGELAIQFNSAGNSDAAEGMAWIKGWIQARAQSEHTSTAYRREAMRFLLFCQVQHHIGLREVTHEHCVNYVDFLAAIPNAWISAARAAPFSQGWAPYKGQLKPAAQKHARAIVQAWFAWLASAGYLPRNPWVLITRRVGDEAIVFKSAKGVPPKLWEVIVGYLASQRADDASAQRVLFVLCFGRATGLRPSELLNVKLGNIVDAGQAGLVLSVVGKGRKPRLVPIPSVAVNAMHTYLASRGVIFGATNNVEVPLVAALTDPTASVSYRVFLRSFRAAIRNAVNADHSLGVEDKRRALAVTLHSLRHTHGAEFARAGGALTVLQANFGHSDIRTTAGYWQGELDDRAKAMELVFGS